MRLIYPNFRGNSQTLAWAPPSIICCDYLLEKLVLPLANILKDG